MGMLQDAIRNWWRKRQDLEVQPVEDLPDDMTTDKVLRGLRRERRLQFEEQEKKVLREEIKAYQKERQRRLLWGFKTEAEKRKEVESPYFEGQDRPVSNLLHQKNVMMGKGNMINKGGGLMKRRKKKGRTNFI